MNKWLKLSKKRRIEILEQVNNRLGLPVQAVEKDWWVTMVLKAVFSSRFAEHFVFKGGTSLSKAYHLIDRFSEDIDLAIDRKFLGFDGKDVMKITGKSETYSRTLIAKIKASLNRPPHQFITIEEFCQYTGLELEKVLEIITD